MENIIQTTNHMMSDGEWKNVSAWTSAESVELNSGDNLETTISSIKSTQDDTYTKAEVDTALGLKVDRAEGKSLIADSEISRLAEVHNYDDSSVTSRLTTIESSESAWNSKYDKPKDGIPGTDMTQDVQASLSKADTALQSKDIENKADKSTTIAGYGITDASITGTGISLGGSTIASEAAASEGVQISLVTTGEKYTWSAKQDALTTNQLDAVNSGINDTRVSVYDGYSTTIAEKANINSPALTGVPTAPTPATTENSTQVATTAFVQSAIDSKIAASDAMIYKGTLGEGGTIEALPSTTAQTGWTYKVITEGTYDTHECEVGDMIVCLTDGSESTPATWTVIQQNIDGAVIGPDSAATDSLVAFNGSTGKLIKDSGYTMQMIQELIDFKNSFVVQL